MKKFIKYLQLDLRRHDMLLKSQFNAFIKSYRTQIPPGFNTNSGLFWGQKLNSELNESHNHMFNHKNRTIANILKAKQGKLLDVGFGNGHIEELLLNCNSDLEFYGIDISEQAIEKAKSKIKGVFKNGSIYKIPFNNNFFDCVIALDVFEHIPSHKVFIAYKEINRVLKNKGIFILSVPLNEGLIELVKKNQNPNAHLRMYTPEIIITELELSGFKIIKRTFLYAFKSLYWVKTILIKYLPIIRRLPNLVIIETIKK